MPAAGLSGETACPAYADTATMTQWCTQTFGGQGGALTASVWDSSTQTFSCICNGNADASLTITRQSRGSGSSTKGYSSSSSSSRLISSSSSSSSSSSPSSLLSPSSSSSPSSSASLSSPSSPLSSSSSSSFEELSASSASSSDAALRASCSWSGVFTPYPDGVQCMVTTGVCPSSCNQLTPLNLCNNAYTNSQTCTSPSNHVVAFTCLTCNGRNYTISSTAANSCTRYYSEKDTCNAQTVCSGHGCCVGSTTSSGGSSNTAATCTCFSDNTNGFYTGNTCSSCQSGYELNSASLCLTATNKVQFILASIAKTWTMVAPNMAVLFLFVLFGVTRKLSASDRPFDLTGLRRANLSTVQVARRRHQSLFHSKYIPMRPAKSRSFANPHQPQTRGPPAF